MSIHNNNNELLSEEKAVKKELRYLLNNPHVVGVGMSRASPQRYAIVYVDDPSLPLSAKGLGVEEEEEQRRRRGWEEGGRGRIIQQIARDTPTQVEDLPVVIRNVGRVRFLSSPTGVVTIDPRNPFTALLAAAAASAAGGGGGGRGGVTGTTTPMTTMITRARVRPLLAGVSISPIITIGGGRGASPPPPVGTGTLGAFFKIANSNNSNSNSNNRTLLITNNHVLVNDYRLASSSSSPSSSTSPPLSSSASDIVGVIQPGVADGGSFATDRIATLYRWVPIIIYPESSSLPSSQKVINKVDLAVALLDENVASDPTTTPLVLTPYQLAIPIVATVGGGGDEGGSNSSNSSSSPSLLIYNTEYYDDMLRVGDTLHKVGRSTGYTSATVTDVSAMIKVTVGRSQNGESYYALFDDLIVTDAMALPGDSGSIGFTVREVVQQQQKSSGGVGGGVGVGEGERTIQLYPAGLLFAGSDSITVFCKMENVVKALSSEAGIRGEGGPLLRPLSDIIATTATVASSTTPTTTTTTPTTTTTTPTTTASIPLLASLALPFVMMGFLGISLVTSQFMSSNKTTLTPPSPPPSPPPPSHPSAKSKEESRGVGGVGAGAGEKKEKRKKRECSLCSMLKKVKEEVEKGGGV